MRIVVADTGPLNYLILIGAIELLPKLFQSVLMPEAVRTELRHPGASPLVRNWAAQPPAWMQVQAALALATTDPMLRALGDGEAAAIALAHQVRASLILMDDRAGVAIARQQGFAVTGTLGVLDRAARDGLIDLAAAFDRLKATSFRHRPEMLDSLLEEQLKRGHAP